MSRPWTRRALGGLLIAAVFGVSACATAGRQAAIKLADEGGVAAKQTETLLIQTSGSLQPYVEGQFLLSPIRGTEPPSAELLKSVNTVERALTLRIRVIANLAKAYAAMKEHASHDAAAAVEKGVTDLTGSVNAYAAVISPGAALIPETAAFVVAKAAGAIAGAKQVKELKRIDNIRGVEG